MKLYIEIEDIVRDIQSGKKDLTEVIIDYEKQLDKEQGNFSIQESNYESIINDLRGDVEKLESIIEKREDKIGDLEYLIEELRVTISTYEKEIDELHNKINRLETT
jgi:chromosome segregation ATPase